MDVRSRSAMVVGTSVGIKITVGTFDSLSFSVGIIEGTSDGTSEGTLETTSEAPMEGASELTGGKVSATKNGEGASVSSPIGVDVGGSVKSLSGVEVGVKVGVSVESSPGEEVGGSVVVSSIGLAVGSSIVMPTGAGVPLGGLVVGIPSSAARL